MPRKLILDKMRCASLDYNYEGTGLIHFCFYKKMEKNVIKQQTRFTTCRELMIENLIHDMKNIDKNRLRILISATINDKISRESVIKKIELGIKMANIVNNEYHMQPIIYKVLNNDILNNNNNVTYPIIELSASKKWQRSPQMLSLFLLFIKNCNIVRYSKIKTFKGLMSTINRTPSIYTTLKINNKKITTFLDNYTKLFKNLPMKKNYQSKTYNTKIQQIQYEGITKLFNNESRHKLLDERFANLLPDK